MEKMRMMEETTMRQSHWWLFDSHNNGRSQWLQSTLSDELKGQRPPGYPIGLDLRSVKLKHCFCLMVMIGCLLATITALDDKTKAMLRIIEEDADSFAQLAEMYYKKRPQLVGMVEDLYRAHRSLAEQFDHLRHDPGARRISPLARSFCLSTDQPKNGIIDPHKSYDGCFTKLAFDSKDLFTPLSKGELEEPLDLLLKPFAGRYTDTAYDSDGSIDSEVDDPVPYAEPHHHETVDLQERPSSDGLNRDDLMAEIERLEEENMIQKKQVMEKEKTIEELKLKLSERATKVIDLEEEGEEIGKLAMNFKKEKERLTAENATLNKLLLQKQEETRKALGALRMEIQEQKGVLEEKDEEKRETIRQLSVAIEMLKGENRLLKKTLVANESNKRWNPFDSQVLKGFGKLLNCSIVSSQPSVVPL